MLRKILILKSSSLSVNVCALFSTPNLGEILFNLFGVEGKGGDEVVPSHALGYIGVGSIAPFTVILGT
jgi:hypothetical protein